MDENFNFSKEYNVLVKREEIKSNEQTIFLSTQVLASSWVKSCISRTTARVFTQRNTTPNIDFQGVH